MDLVMKKAELIKLIETYLNQRCSLLALQNFVWEVIDYYKNNKHIDYEKEDEVFWYAIWQIQHIADDGHEKHGMATRELTSILSYLTGNKKMPSGCSGIRP